MFKEKISAFIPARLESTRLPEKLLKDLGGKPLLQRVYENISGFGIFDSIYVATDSQKIKKACTDFNCPVIMTRSDHESGTSRIAEASKNVSADIIVNIQGDEPFLKKEQIESLIQNMLDKPEADIATLVYPESNKTTSSDPNIVKAVMDINGFALYFSRFPIPFNRDTDIAGNWLHHLGVYAFRKNFLDKYPSLKMSNLEKMEKLEQLTFLHNGYKILLVETKEKALGIDTEKDLLEANRLISS